MQMIIMKILFKPIPPLRFYDDDTDDYDDNGISIYN